MVWSTIIKIVPIITRFLQTGNRIATGESAFLTRFPPNLRPYVKDVLRGFTIITTGGVISDIIQQDWN